MCAHCVCGREKKQENERKTEHPKWCDVCTLDVLGEWEREWEREGETERASEGETERKSKRESPKRCNMCAVCV